MNKIYIFFGLVLLVSCGLSVEEKKNVALNACSIMGETKKSDSLFRMQTIVDARETIGGEPFVGGDDAILEAFNFGLCEELVLNESYNESLQPLKDAKRERERIAAEKLAEENRIAAEKQRIADSKPTVKEEFHSNGKLRSRTMYQSKNDGGKKHGLSEYYSENGKLGRKENYKDGKEDGPAEGYHSNGQLSYKVNYKDGKKDGPSEYYYENGDFKSWSCFKNGEALTYKDYCWNEDWIK